MMIQVMIKIIQAYSLKNINLKMIRIIFMNLKLLRNKRIKRIKRIKRMMWRLVLKRY